MEPGFSASALIFSALALLSVSCGHGEGSSTSPSGAGGHAGVPSDADHDGASGTAGDGVPAADGGSTARDPAMPGTSGRQPELVLEAELETPGPQVPAPGHAHVISVSRYRVLRVVHGSYAHPVVLVGHDRADMRSAAFQAGVRHRLELVRQFPPNTSLQQPFASEAGVYGTYFCVAYRVLPAGGGGHD